MNIPPCYVHFPKWKRQLDKVTLDVPVNPRFQDVVHPVVISPPQSFTCCIGGGGCLPPRVRKESWPKAEK